MIQENLMKHQSVSSSNIESVAYDSGSQKLQVKMRHGKTYEYSKVPENVHRGLLEARSIGKFHYDQVFGKYPYEEVE